jgi:hypothetical protein
MVVEFKYKVGDVVYNSANDRFDVVTELGYMFDAPIYRMQSNEIFIYESVLRKAPKLHQLLWDTNYEKSKIVTKKQTVIAEACSD